MKQIALPAAERETGTKGKARRVRMAGSIPGVVYGPEQESYSVSVTEKDLRAALKEAAGSTSIFDLTAGNKNNMVIIRDVQRDPITSRVTHVDFHAVSMNRPINIAVPINFVGTPVGVKTDGGIMQTTMREINLLGLPKDMPDNIEINVEELGIGDSIHLRDLTLEGVEITDEIQRTVVVISAPTVSKIEEEEMEAGEEGEEGEEGAEGEGGEAKAEGGDDKADDAKKEDKKE